MSGEIDDWDDDDFLDAMLDEDPEIDVRMEVFESIYGDLPDGAYFQMAEQQYGLMAEDFVQEEDE